jgi:hypothetical protein
VPMRLLMDAGMITPGSCWSSSIADTRPRFVGGWVTRHHFICAIYRNRSLMTDQLALVAAGSAPVAFLGLRMRVTAGPFG